MALSEYALTTVAHAEAHGGLSTSATVDAKIESLINAMSDRMERECSRKFKARDLVEWYNISQHQDELVLRNYPIIRAPACFYGQKPCMTVSYSGSAISATIAASLDRMTVTTYDASGVRTQNDLTYATYGSVSALATAINGISGFTATVAVNVPAYRIHPMTGFDLLATTAFVTYPYLALRNPATDFDLGVIQNRFWQVAQWTPEQPRGNMFLPPGPQYVLVEYRAGFETIPYDLQMLCNELVIDVYNRSLRDVTMESEKLGDYSYKLADMMTFNQSIRERLNRYMRIAVGGV